MFQERYLQFLTFLRSNITQSNNEIIVEDALGFGDIAYDSLEVGNKFPRSVAGAPQSLDSGNSVSTYFKNACVVGKEGWCQKWLVEYINRKDSPALQIHFLQEFAQKSSETPVVIDRNNEHDTTFQRYTMLQTRVAIQFPNTVLEILFPVGMTSGPSLQTISAAICAYLDSLKKSGVIIRNRIIELLQFVKYNKFVASSATGIAPKKRKLKTMELQHIHFLAELLTELKKKGMPPKLIIQVLVFLKVFLTQKWNILFYCLS
jgi:hypothetical protein